MKKLTYLFLIIFAIQSAGFALGTTAGTNILNAPRAVTLNFSDQNNNGAITRNSTNTVTSNVKAVYGLSGTFSGGQINQTTGAGVEVGFTTHTISNQSNTAITINANNGEFILVGSNPGYVADWKTHFGNDSGYSSEWILQNPNLPLGIYNHASAIYKNRIFIIGGQNSSGTILNSVYATTINADGSLTAWSLLSGSVLPNELSEHAVVTYKNFIYVLGGVKSGNEVATVYVASVNAQGVLSNWVNLTSTPFPNAKKRHTATVYGSRIYVVGGSEGDGITDKTYFSDINVNGTLSGWVETTALPAVRWNHSAIIYNHRIYVLGGDNNPSAYSNTLIATINANGTLSSWTTSPQTFPFDSTNHTSHFYNGRIYVTGGEGGASETSYTLIATVNANGTLSAWTLASELMPQGRAKHSSVFYDGKVYVFGGKTGYVLNITASSNFVTNLVSRRFINTAADASQDFNFFTTPSNLAFNASQGLVTINYFLSWNLPATSVGSYTGFNGTSYGGSSKLSALTTTTVAGPDVQLIARYSNVIAPTSYVTNGGSNSSAVPGARIVFTYLFKNMGSGVASTVNIKDAIPIDTEFYSSVAHSSSVGFTPKYYFRNATSTINISNQPTPVVTSINAIEWIIPNLNANAIVTLNYSVVIK